MADFFFAEVFFVIAFFLDAAFFTVDFFSVVNLLSVGVVSEGDSGSSLVTFFFSGLAGNAPLPFISIILSTV